MPRCLISLGANLGDPLHAIHSAVELLRQRLRGDEISGLAGFELSRPFRTPPVGGPAGQPPFINAVAAIDTRLTLHQVWQTIRAVEQELGRERDRRWEARRIDLDILLYEQQRIWTPHLKVPHPRMCMRRFILIPASDVAAAWLDPVTGRTIGELAQPLQSGPGSLCLVASDTVTAQSWLDEVAKLAMAASVPAEQQPSARGSRWVSLVSTADFERQMLDESLAPGEPRPKLTVFLTNASQAPASDWENQQLRLAQQLQLLGESSSDSNRQDRELPDWVGPRYLLPSDDGQWAVHEMVAALEAMDCPIEPIVW